MEGGGETAFPVAENETLNFEVGDEFKNKMRNFGYDKTYHVTGRPRVRNPKENHSES